MFKALGKLSGKKYTVYGVRKNEDGGTDFLLYIYMIHGWDWSWQNSEDYEPLEID